MRTSWHRFFPFLAFSGLLLSLATTAPAFPQSDAEIVRLAYIQGDVRVSRGNGRRPDLNQPWEQAEYNTPIQQGFSLATGTGRAEIEFADGSTVYLAENSVLLFPKLQVKHNAPVTQLELLTGTATVSANILPNEQFRLDTPAGPIEFPKSSFLRVDSYLDGTAITPQGKDGEDALESKNEKIHLAQGETVIYNKGRQLQISGAEEPPARLAWDRWVLARVEQKRVETAAALKASGLSSPFPGLAHLYKEGTFFQCAQYGTCWRPRPTRQPATARRPIITVREYPLFCSRESLRVESVVDPKTGKEKVIRQTIVPNFWDLEICPFEICPEISTIRYSSNQYALLVKPANALSRKRGKLPVPPRMRRGDAVRWVRVGDRVGFMLRNPLDERAKMPINLRHGVFLLPSKPGGVAEQVALNSSEKVKKLPKPPKEFQAEFTPALPRAAAPEIQLHFMREAASGTADDTNPNVRTAALRITYDYKTRNFVAASAVASGWTSKPVVIAKLSSRGGFSGVEGSRSYGNNGGSLGTQSSGASSFRSAGAQASSSGGGTANSSSGASTGSATTAKSVIPRQN